ncbi:MAG: PQQ-binding-like beta-propeller repeat protein [Hyphomicrobiales bacterium]|nr:PQQ-binding-like beta-propeller repeat protein [Hyphomicrobiales bacterium]
MRQKLSNSSVRDFRGPAVRIACILAAVSLLAGCGGSSPSLPSLGGIFDEKEEVLAGKRVAVLQTTEGGETTASATAKEPVSLPSAIVNASWSQPGGAATNAPGHLSVSGSTASSWRSDAGEGSSKRGRLTAVPVVADGKVFTLDTEGNVSAFSASGGSRLWRVSLRPDNEKARAGFGGGLAYDGGRLFAATGFGIVYGLDPSSGKTVWTKSLVVPIRNSPTATAGKVFIVNVESQLYALNAADGAEVWSSRGLPEIATMLSNVSPAVSGSVVVVPFASGEIAAFDVSTGAPQWTDSISRTSAAGTTFAAIGEPARPAIDGTTVYAMSRSGRLIATAKSNGERLWSRDISGSQTPWIAGDNVFVVDVTGKVMALSRKDGKTRWTSDLPDAKNWSGPVLASGKLWLASDKGLLVGVDAVTGAIASKADLGAPVYISPVVANGKLYVLSDKASLIAMN